MNSKINVKVFFLLFLICVCSNSLYAQSIPPFKKGERVVFVGNSITHGGHYHSFVWLYYMTRFPNKPITIMNAGIGGESAWDIKDRLDYDVFDRKPTYVTLTFGMNDTGYDIFWKENAKELSEQRIEKSLESFREIEKRLLAENKMTKVLIGGSPYDETTKLNSLLFLHKNDAILKIIDAQRKAAKKNGWGFVDFNQPMVQISLEEQKKDSTFTFCRVDRIHPDNDGQMVMAYLFLKAQGLAGVEVSDISIDANNKNLLSHRNCKVSKLKKEAGGLSFDYLANSLPYPLDSIPRGWGQKKSQAEVLKVVPFMEEMNRETLKVTGLKGNYKLLIDNEEIGTWSGDELAKGINLAAESKTPQYQQALAVMHLNEYRWEIEKTFREYAWCEFGFFQQKGLLFADDRKAIEVMDENLDKNVWLKGRRDMYSKMMFEAVRDARQQEMEVLINKIYEINKPVVRKVLLRKI